MARKVIITVAQTGAFQGKEANPALPIQPAEIIQSAYECYNAGASIVHVHVRDKDGVSTNDPKIYSEVGSGIKAKCPLIIQYSTAPANVAGAVAEDGMKLLYADDVFLPEMCSLDCSLIATAWQNRIVLYEWTREFLVRHAKRMLELNIKPEIELFNPTSIEDVVKYVYPQGVLKDPVSYSFVMGMDKISQQSMEFSFDNLYHCVNKLPKGSLFSIVAISQNQLPGTVMTMLLGGNARVGFEDNVYFKKGELAKNNAQLVERMAKMVEEFGFEVATPADAKQILGITR